LLLVHYSLIEKIALVSFLMYMQMAIFFTIVTYPSHEGNRRCIPSSSGFSAFIKPDGSVAISKAHHKGHESMYMVDNMVCSKWQYNGYSIW
jgi:hypothetical protein